MRVDKVVTSLALGVQWISRSGVHHVYVRVHLFAVHGPDHLERRP